MLQANAKRLQDIIDKTTTVLNNLVTSQKLILEALESCDESIYEDTKAPIKGISQQINEIDQSIVTVCSLYSPEAKDLREMVAFLKITSSLQRIVTNEKNYIKNMNICNPQTDVEMRSIIVDSLAINRCTIKALEYSIDMVNEVEDRDRLREYASKISVEASKTDDIYSLMEKEILQSMNRDHLLKDEYVNLLKYIRKNLKIIERLEDISSRLIFARIGGNTPKEMTQLFIEAEKFQGTSLIEILQNCVIFNDGCFTKYTDKAVRPDKQIHLEHNKPMIFGKDRNKGLVLNGLKLEVVTLGENGITESDLLVHNAKEPDPTLHSMLVRLDYPLATGIIRAVEELTFEAREEALTKEVSANSKFNKVDDLFFSGETYEVK